MRCCAALAPSTLRTMPLSRDAVQQFADHLSVESSLFREALATTDGHEAVPSCPDWDADDLLWHLGECQWFWARIVVDDLRTDQQIEDLVEAARPTDRASLLAFFDTYSQELCDAGRRTDPNEPRWMWVADSAQHHVGYLLRRQAHEALVHRVDAQLCAGLEPTAPDVAFAADGVDEALVLIHGNAPSWGTFTPGTQHVSVHATDTGDRWTLRLGRFAGTRGNGEQVDMPLWAAEREERVTDQAVAAVASPPNAVVAGPAWALDLWLWGRGDESTLRLEGDPDALRQVREIVADGVA